MYCEVFFRLTFPNREYSDSDVNLTTISKALNSYGRFTVNDAVVFTQTDASHYNARIIEIFADGKIRITFPGGEYSDSDVSFYSLSKAVYSYGNFRVGDDVVFTQTDGTHYNARITEIFEDGKARVTFPNREYSDSDISFGSLSKPLASVRR